VSASTRTWLVAYDIRDPKRLRSVHRTLRKQGIATQYSLFTLLADDAGLDELFAQLASLIDPRRDDVRAYAIPARARVWSLGRPTLPQDIELTGTQAAAHLLDLLGARAAARQSSAQGHPDHA